MRDKIAGLVVAQYKVRAHGVELKAIAALRRVAGTILQMDVTVPLVVQGGMNAF